MILSYTDTKGNEVVTHVKSFKASTPMGLVEMHETGGAVRLRQLLDQALETVDRRTKERDAYASKLHAADDEEVQLALLCARLREELEAFKGTSEGKAHALLLEELGQLREYANAAKDTAEIAATALQRGRGKDSAAALDTLIKMPVPRKAAP